MSRFRQPANHQANAIEAIRAIWAVLNQWFQGDKLVLRPGAVVGSLSKSGTGTIAGGTTTVAVAHGLGATPASSHITVTPTNSPTNDPGHIWVDTIGGTTFAVNCTNDPGASGMTFGWRVSVV